MGTQRRAIGIIRVSETKGREGESFASPVEQRERIAAACERDGIELLRCYEELDVSGGKPLDKRPGLSQAVAAIEAGEAEVVAAAYFDRLFRSLTTQAEVLERVEAVGGHVIAVDVGRVTNGSAGQWLSGTMLGAVSEYYRRSIRERAGDAQRRAIERGVPPWDRITFGYRRAGDGRFEPDPETAPLAREAFERRAGGATIQSIREWLAEQGHPVSYRVLQMCLSSRVALGEIHFGSYEPNLAAFEPLVDRDLWQRVQRVSISRGKRSHAAPRLLSRLDVLRCGNCGRRMVLGQSTQKGGKVHYFYRCGSVVTGDCPKRATIAVGMAEETVIAATLRRAGDAEGAAARRDKIASAQIAAEESQARLDSAIRAFAAIGSDEPAAVERLTELRADRDAAVELVDTLGPDTGAMHVVAREDWDRLTLDEQRAIIRATFSRITVAQGRGDGRLDFELLGQ